MCTMLLSENARRAQRNFTCFCISGKISRRRCDTLYNVHGKVVEMINENRNVSEESSIMQRSYADVAKGSGMSDTKQ